VHTYIKKIRGNIGDNIDIIWRAVLKADILSSWEQLGLCRMDVGGT